MRLHLVDGTYELFRCYYGAPPARAPDGREVGAVRGLLRTLLSLLREDGVSHVACAFDHVIESFRNGLFAGYKTREGVPEELLAQFPLAERATGALGVVVWPMVEFEADDALATAAARWADDPSVEQIVICTPDKDMAQCVRGSRVVCLDRMRRRLLDAATVVARFGIPPESIPDWLALVGDDADGIPGIPGWGAKSSSLVLSRFGRIEAIPDDPARWGVPVRGASTLARALGERRHEAALYKRLATLRADVPLVEQVSDLEWRGVRREELQALCRELGDAELLDWDLSGPRSAG
ncbi:MAG TPA: 5'-3' exonuclease H3TH domain-containing protein [Vicinamibacteria bacterium]|nr:5'-3' exonuclease H3TH domain-containing protein [Vicinamibacteria bacterium]